MADLIDKKLLLDSLELLIIPEDNNDDANYNNGIEDAIRFVKGMKTVNQ